ncbi:hypothetical protein [Coleofasciculus chthonoplastes]|uniref:hypothetical protein n=1 Tax=Coleofasciculus chthonoplastes TaxID=64178 RepID=UPI0032FFDE33
MNEPLLKALRQLNATGGNGFEGLIAKLLEALTGQHFHLAQSGTQSGRDMSASRPNYNVIAVECKRYGKDTELNQRELLGEIVQVVQAIPDLDLWVLVASRDIPSQLEESLRYTANQYGITYFSISTDDGEPSSLDVLCTQAIDLVIEHLIQHLGNQPATSSIRQSLEAVAASEGFNQRVEQLRQDFLSPLIGYDNWRVELNSWFRQCLKSGTESRACFGQAINCEADGIQLIKREEAWTKLDEWLDGWKSQPRPFVVLGEEGDGKTWSAVSWLCHRIKTDQQFPPVLFLSSTNVDSNEPETLLSGFLSSPRRFPVWQQEQWNKRIARWTQRDTSHAPIFILVLDGINERRDCNWWRTLLEKLMGQPWGNQVAVLITCRSAYWQRNFEPLGYIQADKYELPAYSDRELQEALDYYNLRRSDIQALLPLIRKPRYFDLVVKYRERIEETGDVTIARLIYEDWRDRLERKRDIPLNDQSFQSCIRDLAGKYQDGSKYVTEQDIDNVLPLSADKLTILEELRTGGILENKRGNYKVNEQFLRYGFALLLIDELEEESENQEQDLTDVIAKWLEPQAEMDIKAAICELATLYALHLRDYPREAKLALLQTLVNSQNPEPTVETEFIAYLPIEPQLYIDLAEIVWSDSRENVWGQELLMRSFLRWRESPKVISELHSAFESWLGFVHLYGFSWQRCNSRQRAEEINQEIYNRIGEQLQPGQQFTLGKYRFTAIEDDGLLRLGRVAMAVISHLPRDNFIHIIATGCLAEAIMGEPDKYNLLAWLFRTASESVWAEVKEEVEQLLEVNHIVAKQAAYRLLSFEGSPDAYQLQQSLPQDLFPPHSILEEYKEDPCTSGFQWTQSDCETCLTREDITLEQIARQIKEHCINPNLSVPSDLGQRLAPLTETISIQQVVINLGQTIDDVKLKDYEPALCAYAPNAIAELVRRITRQIDEREDFELRQLSIRLKKYALIFGREEQESIYRAWTRLQDKADSWNEAEKCAEMFLFRLILKTQNAEDQLISLMGRPEQAQDLVAYEQMFLPIINWDIVRDKFNSPLSPISLRRILWFLSIYPKNLPQDILNQQIVPVLTHEDSIVRLSILRLLYFREDRTTIHAVVEQGWTWKTDQDDIENHWGSLLLGKYATFLPYSKLRDRIHPLYLGYAVQCRGMDNNEVSEYAEHIHQIWSRFAKEKPTLPPSYPSISVKASLFENDDIEIIHWTDLSEKLTIFSNGFAWGGIGTGNIKDWQESREEMMSPNRDHNYQKRRQAAQETVEKQEINGNTWFAKRFFTNALEQIVIEHSDLVEQWLEAISTDNPEEIQQLHLVSSFYEALCEVLLKQPNPDKGIQLYWQIQKLERRIGIEDKHSGFEFLDYALFQAACVDSTKQAWRTKLEQCKTDRELLELAILAQSGNGRDWLWLNIESGIQSLAPIEKSRVITLLAFIQESKAGEWLNSLVQEQPDTWLKKLAEISHHRWQKNNWAIHWFCQFINADDDVISWTSFRLFLRCVDSRFWVWRDQVKAEGSVSTFNQKRRQFLEDNLETIKHRIQKNEEPLEKNYLGHKILFGQAFPWMSDPLQ